MKKQGPKKEEAFQMAKDAKTEGWFDGIKYVPFEELPDEYLQNAKIHAQKKELYFFNRTNIFSDLVEKLDSEAARRGKVLRDLKSEYHNNTRRLKNVVRKNQALINKFKSNDGNNSSNSNISSTGNTRPGTSTHQHQRNNLGPEHISGDNAPE